MIALTIKTLGIHDNCLLFDNYWYACKYFADIVWKYRLHFVAEEEDFDHLLDTAPYDPALTYKGAGLYDWDLNKVCDGFIFTDEDGTELELIFEYSEMECSVSAPRAIAKFKKVIIIDN